MPRDHGRILCSIWDDPAFIALDGALQRVYFVLLSEPSISNAGVSMLTLRRWSKLAADTPEDELGQQLHRLAEHDERFVVVDWDTEEVLVRSFIRRDGVAKQPHVLLNAVRSAVGVRSAVLRREIAAELRRVDAPGRVLQRYRDEVERVMSILDGNPSGKGSEKGFPKASSGQVDEHQAVRAGVAAGTLREPFPEGYGEPHGEGEGVVGTSPTEVTTSLPKITKRTIDSEFDRFWAVYPRKVSKQGARDKFAAARKRGVEADTLVDGARRYAEYCIRVERDPEKIKHPTSWLNQGCWDDQHDAMPSVPIPDALEWLKERWRLADTDEVAKRTGLAFHEPPRPLDLAPGPPTVKWHRFVRQEWITDHRAEILGRLKERSS